MMNTETKKQKKTVYGLRLRPDDSKPWSEIFWFKTKGRRDNSERVNRIIGGIRTHSVDDKKTLDEIEELEFAEE